MVLGVFNDNRQLKVAERLVDRLPSAALRQADLVAACGAGAPLEFTNAASAG
jgi:hypothetical protein